jgi:hypothetical protein
VPRISSLERPALGGERFEESIVLGRTLLGEYNAEEKASRKAVLEERSFEKSPSRRLLGEYSGEENTPRKSWLLGHYRDQDMTPMRARLPGERSCKTTPSHAS